MNRSASLKRRTPLAAGGAAMAHAKGWKTRQEAEASPRGLQPGAEAFECPDRRCPLWHVRAASPAPRPRVPAPRRETGFPAKVKLAARTRAGGGDAEEARCEACGKWLGRYGGQVQHRLARKSGGSRSPVINGISNALLLCGDAFTGCHGLCEKRSDKRMRLRGYWIEDGNGPDYDPRFVPITRVDGEGNDIGEFYLSANGAYSETPPDLAGAA